MWYTRAPLLRRTGLLPLNDRGACMMMSSSAVAGVACQTCASRDNGRAAKKVMHPSLRNSSAPRRATWLESVGLGRKRNVGAGATGGGAVASYATASAHAAGAGPASRSGARVCILGGGFGGLYAAVRLDQLVWPSNTKPQVTLIDQSDRFVFKPLLYDYVAGSATAWEVAPYFQQLLAPYNINFLQGRVDSVAPDSPQQGGGSGAGGRVTLASGEEVEYDWLVVALGGESSTFGIPGVQELAVPFCTFTDAQQAKARLQQLQLKQAGLSEVVVVGGGYAGIELATTAAEMLAGRGRVKLVSAGSDILESSPPGQRSAARSVLNGKSVTIITNGTVASIKRVGGAAALDTAPRMVYLKMPDGSQQLLQADLVLWTAGSQPASKGAGRDSPRHPGRLSLPFPLTDKGATATDQMLRVLSHSHVFALGDVSGVKVPDTDSLPITAQVAFQQADYVAWNLWAAINGRPLLPFRYQHLGEMMSLGAVNGAVTLPIPLPPPIAGALQGGLLGNLLGAAGVKVDSADERRRITVDGPLAGALRRAAYWYRQPTGEQRLRVGASWLEQLASDGSKAVQSALSGRPPSSWRD